MKKTFESDKKNKIKIIKIFKGNNKKNNKKENEKSNKVLKYGNN
tara:strand:- start:1242 stop:1373 length:132 start_codon:yes stop_codon:yes gene_type:complete